MTAVNRQYRLKQRPEGRVARSDFELVEAPVPRVPAGGLLVRVRFLSIDPTNRVWLKDIPQYMPPVALGEVMRSYGVGEVIAAEAEDFAPGDWVAGMVGWQDYAALLPGGPFGVTRLPMALGLPPQAFLGVAGGNGVTAYYGLVDLCRPQPGETVIVSAAAGAVGSVVGQLAKIQGARAVGIAGGPAKRRFLTEELGFDAAIDYKAEDWRQQLRAAAPDGADILFENVGGPVMEAVLAQMKIGGRVALCGLISAYNGEASTRADFSPLIMRRLTAHGFNIIDYAGRWPQAVERLAGWVREGRLVGRETTLDGLETCPDALNLLFDGGNTGKLLVRVGDPA